MEGEKGVQEYQESGGKSKLYKTMLAVGLAAFMIKDQSVEAHSDVAVEDDAKVLMPYAEMTSGSERFDHILDIEKYTPDLREKKERLEGVLSEAQTFFDIASLVEGSAVSINGKKIVLSDEGSFLPVENVIVAARSVEDQIYQAVYAMNPEDSIDSLKIELPAILEEFAVVRGQLHEFIPELAQYVLQYNNPENLSVRGREFSSVQSDSYHGVEYSIHTIIPDDFAENEIAPTVLVPGYATDHASYERFAVDSAMRGIPFSVINIEDLNPDVSESGADFSDLPPIPQAFSGIAQESLLKISENFGDKVNFVGYSTGSIGAAVAAENNPEVVESLTLFNPAGLSQESRIPYMKAVSMGLNVLRHHIPQVKEMSSYNEHTGDVHERVSEGPAQKKSEAYGGSGLKQNIAELKAGHQVTAVRLEKYLGQMDSAIPKTVYAFENDQFFPASEIKSQLGKDVSASESTSVHVVEGSHSTIKYNHGPLAHEFAMGRGV